MNTGYRKQLDHGQNTEIQTCIRMRARSSRRLPHPAEIGSVLGVKLEVLLKVGRMLVCSVGLVENEDPGRSSSISTL